MKVGLGTVLGIVVLSLFTISSVNSQRFCYTCDSSVDADCATLLIPPQISTECPSEDDSCVIAIVNGATIRGCSSEIEPTCTEETCFICSEDYCNTELYPSDRLICHKCSNCDKITSNTYFEVCEIYDPDDSCYVYADTEIAEGLVNIISERGCYSTISSNGPTICDSLESSGKCVKCQGNGCNSKSTFDTSELSCIKCNSQEDPTCAVLNIGSSVSCSYNVLLGDPEFCFTYTSAEGVVSKGCLGDYDTTTLITSDCNLDDPKCSKCSGNDCNRAYGSCVSCNGLDDEWCASLDGDYQPFQCESSGAVGCFMSKIDGNVVRGCINQLQASELAICERGNTCKICEGDNCNSKVDYQQCYSCDSESDAACVGDSISSFTLRTCTDYMDQCQTHIDLNTGIQYRGCKNEIQSTTNCDEPFCKDCSDNNCNSDIIPENRISCHVCSGEDCKDAKDEHKQVCQYYETPESCYSIGTKILGVDQYYRGCNSDHSEGKELCSSSGDLCIFCSDSNCNDEVLKKPSTLKCVKCDSETDPSCHLDQSDTEAELCSYELFSNEVDQCYTIQNSDGSTVRGCLYDAPEDIQASCLEGSELCKTCDSEKCNIDEIKIDICYRCDDCQSVEGIEPIVCPTGTRTGCFHSEFDVVVRGCVSQLVDVEYDYCLRNSDQCKICEGGNCNSKAEYQQCISCDSESDAACVGDPYISSALKTCTDYMDQCQTNVDLNTGIQYRGCKNEIQSTTECEEPFCKDCSDNNCNTDIIPENRISCHVCSGEDCKDAKDEHKQVCQYYETPESCYSIGTKILGVDQYYRGCNSDHSEGKELCSSSGDLCIFCSDSNCNDEALKKPSTLKCVKCDSETDPSCHLDQSDTEAELCSYELFSYEIDQCYTIQNSDGSTVRGCIHDAPEDIQATCLEGSELCKTCDSEKCNTDEIKIDMCYRCDDCQSVEGIEPIVCPTGTRTGCFHSEFDVVVRGCLSQLVDVEYDYCLRNSDQCKICEGGNCNSKAEYQQCISCDSESDVSCVEGTSSSTLRTCTDYLDQCQTHIDLNTGIQYRGCKNEIQSTTECEEPFCKDCSDNNCNSDIIPENRISCHVCSGEDCRDAKDEHKQVCQYYESPESCYSIGTKVLGVDQYYRGCNSDHSEGKELCSSSGELCTFCSDSNCNDETLKKPSTLKCVKCDSETDPSCHLDQSDTEAEMCSYELFSNEIDQCYTIQNSDGSTVRGCIHDAPEDIQTTCLEGSELCKTCDSEKCNIDEIKIDMCYRCDDCQSVEGIEPIVCPTGTRTGCFHSEFDVVVRGCVSQLVDVEYDYCLRNSDQCKLCEGGNCNSKAEYQQCISCDSESDVSCVEGTSSSTLKTCTDYLDQCQTHIDLTTGIQYRGCKNEIQSTAECEQPICKDCSDNNCNTDIVPENRISCHVCSGDDCRDAKDEHKQVCQYYESPESCYSIGTKVLGVDQYYRGCNSDHSEGKELCSSSGELCTFCSDSNCNDETLKKPSTLKCVKCDSETDPSCHLDQSDTEAELCSYELFTNEIDQCYTIQNSDGSTVRGCLHDAPEDIQTTCLEGSELCKTCDSEKCNIDENKIDMCYRCDDCKSVEGIEPIVCPTGTRTGCFHSEFGGLVRGCVSQLIDDEYDYCLRYKDQCKICEGESCNSKEEIQQCYKCDSRDDETCLYTQGDEGKIVCNDYLDQCATYIDDGYTVRGCAAETTEPASCNSATCQVCADSNCNGNVFPSTRLWCHRCVGDTECRNDLANWENTKQICPIYRNPNGCYTLLDDDKVMHRGCNTDPEVDTCDEYGDSCVKCTTSNCNNAPGVRSPTLSCATCKSNDETCAWAQDDGEICKELVWYLEEESCYNVYNEEADTAIRGCTLDDKYSCEGQTNCNECNTDSCNKASYKYHSCYQCSSSTSDLCLNDATELDISVCPGDNQKKDDIGCYMIKTEENFARGCLANLDSDTKAICETEDSICTACYEDGCNDKPGSAVSLQSLPIVILVFAWIVQKLY